MKRKILCVITVFIALLPFQLTCAGFSDVTADKWYAESVDYAYQNGLMNGTGDGMFEPESKITRGMIVTIFYRLENSPAVSFEISYIDVPKNAYYYNPIVWATENKIVNGYSEEMFAPNDNITREQFATILCRYASWKGYISTGGDIEKLSQYEDAANISNYAKDAMALACEHGLIKGVTETTLEPQGHATRAQAAAIFMRFDKLYKEYIDDTQISDTNTGKKPQKPSVGDIANEKEEFTISVSEVSVKAGQVATVTVSVVENPGILGMALVLEYDETALTLTKAEIGEAVSMLTVVQPNKYKSGKRFVWYGETLAKTDIRDGAVLILEFKVSDTAALGTYSVNVSCPNGDMFDNDLEELAPKFKNGSITVVK